MDTKKALTLYFKFTSTPAGMYLMAQNLDFYISELEETDLPIACVVSPRKDLVEWLCAKLNNDLELGEPLICPYPLVVVEPD